MCICWYLAGRFHRSLPVEGEVDVCWVLCIPEQQGGGRYLLCLVGKTGNGGREEGKKEEGWRDGTLQSDCASLLKALSTLSNMTPLPPLSLSTCSLSFSLITGLKTHLPLYLKPMLLPPQLGKVVKHIWSVFTLAFLPLWSRLRGPPSVQH